MQSPRNDLMRMGLKPSLLEPSSYESKHHKPKLPIPNLNSLLRSLRIWVDTLMNSRNCTLVILHVIRYIFLFEVRGDEDDFTSPGLREDFADVLVAVVSGNGVECVLDFRGRGGF
jgi:hypothetical protein